MRGRPDQRAASGRQPCEPCHRECGQRYEDDQRQRLGVLPEPEWPGPDADSDEQFQKILTNNIMANNWLIQMVQGEMRARKDGAIVIISSIGGLHGSPVIGAYNVSKAADFQLARNLAVEYGPDNVRVNCIAPGLIKTDFARALWENPEILKVSLAGTPMGRIGMPEEIAGAAVFLASTAGAYVNGQNIVVDGGATISGIRS